MSTLVTNIRSTGLAAWLLWTSLTAVGAAFQPVSQPDPSFAPSITGGGDSGLPIISADGRYVLFASTADNLTLVSNTIPNASPLFRPLDIFVRDRLTGTTRFVSLNVNGINGGDGDSIPSALSTNAQFALFESLAGNLIAGDTNGASDLFVRDLVNNSTVLVSVSTNGISGNGASRNAVMTPDGRYVAFVSAANNLVAGDTNKIPDVFIRDLQTSTTLLVSVGATATNANLAAPGGSSETPVITPDGRYVAFFSTATNLVAGVRLVGEVYVRDVVAETTTWASLNARAIFFANVGSSNAVACNHHLSDDGQFVAFVVCTNRITGSTTRGLVLRHNFQSGVTDTVHTNAHVPLLPFEDMRNLALTPDGRFLAFAANIRDFSGSDSAVYLWDAQTGISTLVSVNTNGWPTTNAIGDLPAVSADGRFVAFLSNASDLTTNTIAEGSHFYRRDVMAGSTRLVDVDLVGVGAGVHFTAVPSLSADANFVAYESAGTNLVAGDRNRGFDVFLKDFATDTTELISARDPALPSVAPSGLSGTYLYSVSANGRYVAFASEADDLITNDTNGLRDVFVRDLLTGSNILVSVDTNGFAGAGISSEPSISGDGRQVTFSSFAPNLTANDTNSVQDIFIRDLQAGTTTLLSVSSNGVTAANKDSYLPTLAAAGRYVLFRSKASNLAPGNFGSGLENLFIRDRQLNTNYALTLGGVTSAAMTPDGKFIAFVDTAGSTSGKIYVWNTQLAARSTNTSLASITAVAISPDGSKLATFNTSSTTNGLRVVSRVANTNLLIVASSLGGRPGLQFSGDGRFLTYALAGTNQVFLFNAQNNTRLLVSQAYNSPYGGSAVSDSSIISPDGRYVIFRSAATNLVANDFNEVPDLFVYDQTTGTNALLTQSRLSNQSADNRSRTPIFSSNGRAVIFQSAASDLRAGDFNQLGDLFAFEFLYLDIAAAISPAGGKVLSWPAAPGETYRVQSKNNVDDPNWSDVAGAVNILGNRAYLTNAPPIPDQRFYRVLAE